MITSNLFQRILIEPIQSGCNRLYIISGYATSAMAFHHLNELNNLGKTDVAIKLIVGMSSSEGISVSNHNGFRQIVNDFNKQFECSYRISNPPVHSKIYLWLANDEPRISFLGSANYTQTAFNERRQKESLTKCNNKEALLYFESMINDSIYCSHPDSENLIQIFNERAYRRLPRELIEVLTTEPALVFQPDFTTLENVTVSLLDRNGNIHNAGGGLNWGQRERRNPNQAYIQLRPAVYKSDFFPAKGIHFTVLTDDNIPIICTRAQKRYGEAIETPQNNSLLGEYFRKRLDLGNGVFINTQDLIRYGRTDVTFYKIDDENYYMDFSIQ